MLKKTIWFLGTLVLAIMLKVLFRFKHEGREKLPQNEGILIIGRHRSYWDIPMMIVAAGPTTPIVFVAQKKLLKTPLLGIFVRNFAVTIDRDQFKREDFRKMLEVMETEQLVGIYPEGTTRQTDEIRAGVIKFAERLDRDFIPFKIFTDGPYPPKPPFGYPRVKAMFGDRITLNDLTESLIGDESKKERYHRLAGALMDRVDQVGVTTGNYHNQMSSPATAGSLEGPVNRG